MKKHINEITIMLFCFVLGCFVGKVIKLNNENKSLNNIVQEQNEIICEQNNKINELEETIKCDNFEQVELNSCPMCNGSVKIFPVLESFYIECKLCGLHTDYFDSKKELIEYWNNRN